MGALALVTLVLVTLVLVTLVLVTLVTSPKMLHVQIVKPLFLSAYF